MIKLVIGLKISKTWTWYVHFNTSSSNSKYRSWQTLTLGLKTRGTQVLVLMENKIFHYVVERKSNLIKKDKDAF